MGTDPGGPRCICRNAPQNRDIPRRFCRRDGAALVLILLVVTAQFMIAALVINWTYINTARRQLRAAVDASAKASLTTLATSQSTALGRQSGIDIAASHLVANAPLRLSSGDVVFGRSTRGANGAYTFAANVRPFNSVRVQANIPSIATFLGNILGRDRFSLSSTSTAARVDNDVCLVLDRSGSMAWDSSNREFQYPTGVAGLSTLQQYFEPPHPTASRWAALLRGVTTFLDTIRDRDPEAQLALVTFASDYEFGDHRSRQVSTDQALTTSRSSIINAAAEFGQRAIIGDTNPGAGLLEAAEVLNGRRGGLIPRITAQKTIVLFSDGLMTEGPDPVSVAASLGPGFTVHTITFSDGADRDLMQRVAVARGGIHVHATTAAGLIAAFQRIAEQIPNVLTN